MTQQRTDFLARFLMGLTILIIGLPAFSAQEARLPNKKVVDNPIATTRVGQETAVQTPKHRATDRVRLHVGSDFRTAGVGPAAQAEFVTRLSGAISVMAGIGFHGESLTTSGPGGTFKHTLYQAPILLGAATESQFASGWKATFAAGPAYRIAWERATTIEKSESSSALDVFAQVGVEYDWQNAVTGSESAVGASVHRLLGFSGDDRLRPLDSWMMTFGFDL